MKHTRTPAQRRAAQRLARLGRSLQPRAAGDALVPPRPPRAPTGPRFDARLAGFGPAPSGWEQTLPAFDLPTPAWLAMQLPGVNLGFPTRPLGNFHDR